MRILYDLFFFIFSLFYLPAFFIKGKWNRASLSRLGILSKEVQQRFKGKAVLWVHAVSVGEIGLAVGFLNRLRDELKDVQVLITTTTVAGHEVAQKIKNEEDILLYFPADFRFAVRSFIQKTNPSAVVLFETEIWPNLIWELSSRKVPVMILNGRISDKAFRSYRRIQSFLRNVLRHLTAIGVQDERMRERFVELGADPGSVTVTGNLKYDWTPARGMIQPVQKLRLFCQRPGEFLWVAGSTHEGEEETLFEVYSRLKAKNPQLRLLIAPRHLHRVPEIEKAALKCRVALRMISSDAPSQDAQIPGEVWLLNQMGALAVFYELAHAVFVGGSLVPAGGHNLVEPAYFEKPILFGPYMNNFLGMAQEFKKNDAAIEVRNAASLEAEIQQLIENTPRCQSLGRAALDLVRDHRGATEKNKELFLSRWQPQKERKLVSA